MQCMICWEEINTDSLTLSCCPSLCYHKECIINWFRISLTCPFCRRENTLYKRYIPPVFDIENGETIETINPNKTPIKIFAISVFVVGIVATSLVIVTN